MERIPGKEMPFGRLPVSAPPRMPLGPAIHQEFLPLILPRKYYLLPLLLLCLGASCTTHRHVLPATESGKRDLKQPPEDPGDAATREGTAMGATNTRANRAAASGPEKGSMDVAHLLEEFREVGTVNSILVRKNDEMLIEYYTGRMNADQPANIKSASKSILSLLVGIAIEKGYLEGVDQTLHSFFPDYFREEENSEKASITLRDLLTMRSGLQTTSFTRYLEWISSNNWVRFVLERPLIYKTGVEMAYSTGTSHLLSAILTHASGMSTREFAEKYLFGPMGIEIAFWEQDPQGYYLGGNDLAIRPEDMLKIGTMVMNRGVFEGKRLIGEEWLRESFKTYTHSPHSHYDYGYMWWNHLVGEYRVNFAWGYAGQYILMLPELDTVVAITSDLASNNGDRTYQDQIFSFLGSSLIPWLESYGHLAGR